MSGLSLQHVTVRYGEMIAVDDVSLDAPIGRIVSLVGPNGAGKTTLLGVASGALPRSTGEVSLAGVALSGPPHRFAAAGVARTFQIPRFMPKDTVVENVRLGATLQTGYHWLPDLVGGPRARRGAIQCDRRAREAIRRVGLDAVSDRPAGELSYGQVRLMELARALSTAPRIVLLDEPAAGLNDDETVALGQLLVELVRDDDIGVVLVEHHLGLVTGISDSLYVLNAGALIASGEPSVVVADPVVREAYTGGHS